MCASEVVGSAPGGCVGAGAAGGAGRVREEVEGAPGARVVDADDDARCVDDASTDDVPCLRSSGIHRGNVFPAGRAAGGLMSIASHGAKVHAKGRMLCAQKKSDARGIFPSAMSFDAVAPAAQLWPESVGESPKRFWPSFRSRTGYPPTGAARQWGIAAR